MNKDKLNTNNENIWVAVSPEGYLYGEGETEEEAQEIAEENWINKWGGDSDPIPDFNVKLDNGEYDI